MLIHIYGFYPSFSYGTYTGFFVREMTVKQDHMSIRFRRLWQSHVYVEYTVLTKTVLTSSTSASASASLMANGSMGYGGVGAVTKTAQAALEGAAAVAVAVAVVVTCSVG